jgi:N-dimethylarginine dimethylaminohydrolase
MPKPRRLLMVPPRHYEVAYEINPWMSRLRPAERELAQEQWEGLHRVLTEQVGAEVILAEPQEGLPDMVFTANAGLVDGSRVILTNFRHKERQPEAPAFREWFEDNGYAVLELPPGRYFEGEGDALWMGETLFAGYHWRSDVHSHRLIGEMLGARVLSLELSDPRFYHLDTCFCPLDQRTVAYYPQAFDSYARKVIEANVPCRLLVEPEEAKRFACNAVVLGKDVVLNTGCPMLERQLQAFGFTPHATPLDEFIKAGGSAKCLTLHLDDSPTRRVVAVEGLNEGVES